MENIHADVRVQRVNLLYHISTWYSHPPHSSLSVLFGNGTENFPTTRAF